MINYQMYWPAMGQFDAGNTTFITRVSVESAQHDRLPPYCGIYRRLSAGA